MKMPGLLVRVVAVGFVIVAFAAPLIAQERGTVEFGGFASNTFFDKDLALTSSWGAGGRVGAFLHPRLSVEFEGSATSATRNSGFGNVSVGILSGRFTAVALKSGRLSVLLGAGVDQTDSPVVESYGLHGLLGAKFALQNTGDLRLETIRSYMVHGKGTNIGIHVGLSFYRNPFNRITRVTDTVAAAARPDSVSAYETNRLRGIAVRYRSLRDSLSGRPGMRYLTLSSVTTVATMQEIIYYPSDRSELTDSAKAIIDEKLTIFRAYPEMRIVIGGFAGEPGLASLNIVLGLRRAVAAKTYLVSRGIDPIRIEIDTHGDGQLVVQRPGEGANVVTRRGQFRLLIAESRVVSPTR
jgi:peptidoglycan-associated lipoprotein